ncbi:MAG: hypothetical protein HY737_03435 [Candidatus Omnitrophica bacterium]|nr:hypothetical protein [Candidatus Omnitrophota bacterium]
MRNVQEWVVSGLVVTAAVIGSALEATAIEPTTKTEHPSPEPIQIVAAIAIDPATVAKRKAVSVHVKVDNFTLVDPAEAQEHPAQAEGHLHYRVDQGPVIATTATKLSFHDLSSGDHVITVQLAADDHTPIGPPQVLTVKIP